MRRLIMSFAMLIFAAGCASAQTLYEGARVIPGDGSPAIEDAAFLVEGATITRLGKRGEVAAPAGARRVDLAGKTVMPALISTHVHPGFQRGLTYAAENFTRENILDDLNRALYFGISTVMSQGIEKGDVMYRMRADQAAGRLGGARLMLAGRGVGRQTPAPALRPTPTSPTRSPPKMKPAARASSRRTRSMPSRSGSTIAAGGRRRPHRALPRGDRRRSQGRPQGRGACLLSRRRGRAADAGINTFAHLVRDKEMSDALIASMLAHGVYSMPNIGAPERGIHTAPPPWFEEPYLAGMLRDTEPAEVIARIRDSLRAAMPRPPRNKANYESCSAASPSSMSRACASSSAATPGSRITCSAMPSRRSSS